MMKKITTLVLMLAVLFTACTKTDDTYKNWKNVLKEYNGSAYQYFASQPAGSYDSLVKAIDRFPNIKAAVENDSITAFALSNRSFALSLDVINKARRDSIPALDPVDINTMDSAVFEKYLAKYFIKGMYTTAVISKSTDGGAYPSIIYDYMMDLQYVSTNASGFVGGGPKSLLFSDRNNSLDITNWIRVGTTTVDVRTKNAIINYLPANHIFGFGADFIIAVNSIN
ncbi:MAG: hypothetical protein E6Q95_01815 [Chitinophagaceae bacterium]|nr:MAG: hypothetical protein E6Q95_01815 [Chitinophagaceae bacterium]